MRAPDLSPLARAAVLLVLVTGASSPAFAPAAVAGGSTVYTPVPGGPTDYTGPNIPAHCTQDFRLYLPPAPLTPGPEGWPVLVHLSLSGFVTTVDLPQISPNASSGDVETQQLLALALQSGIAVVTARATPSIGANSPAWPADCTLPVVVPGQGLFHPPGWEPPDLPPGTQPYADPLWASAEKDAVLLLQHVRAGASAASGPLAALDETRIAVYGSSAGAAALAWAAFGPDRRGDFDPSWTGQYDEPTRPAAAILRFAPAWYPVFCPGTAVPHFGFGGMTAPASQSYAEVPDPLLVAASPFGYEDGLANETLPTYLLYGDPNSCLDYTPDPAQAGGPGEAPCVDASCFQCGACEGNGQKHSAWSGYAWKELHPTHTRLVLDSAAAFANKPPETGASLIEDAFRYRCDMVSWLMAVLDAPLDPPAGWVSPWADLGGALSGATEPKLCGTGSLLPDSPFTLVFDDLPPRAAAMLVVGVASLSLPFKGGTMVPRPDLVLPAPPADDEGWAWLVAAWPAAIPSGTEVLYQAWVQDASGPAGWLASNAIASTVP